MSESYDEREEYGTERTLTPTGGTEEELQLAQEYEAAVASGKPDLPIGEEITEEIPEGHLPKKKFIIPNKNIPSRIRSIEPLLGGGLRVCVERESQVETRQAIRGKVQLATQKGETIYRKPIYKTVPGSAYYTVSEKCIDFDANTVKCVNDTTTKEPCDIIKEAFRCSFGKVMSAPVVAGLTQGTKNPVSLPEAKNCVIRLTANRALTELVKDASSKKEKQANFLGDHTYQYRY